VPRPNHALRRRAAVALIGFVIVCCQPASALDQASRCLHDKIVADRRATTKYLFCARIGADDPARRDRCLERAEQRLRDRLAVAEDRAGKDGFVCPAGAEALGLDAALSWPLRLLDEEASGTGADCAKRLAAVARRYAPRYSRCVEETLRNQADPDEDAGECADRSRQEFLADWQLAASQDSCSELGAEDAARRIEQEVDESASRLVVRCGDGFVAGLEECDDGSAADDDGCSSDCRIEDCARVGEEVRCMACPDDSVAADDYESCRCPDGFGGEPGACTDIDECAVIESPCTDGRPCVNLPGTWACAIPCTAEAFQQAITDCGAPSGAIAFDCTDTAIAIPAGIAGNPREVECNGLTIDGAGRNIAFELDPLCWQTPLDPLQCPGGIEVDGTCQCPDVDSGDQFLLLRGNGNVVRDLTVRGFFDGIPVRGRGNVVEDVRFERQCDDAFGSVAGGVGNVFRRLTVRDGCDKCSENEGALADTDPDPRVDAHFHSILSDVEFSRCRTPIRVASSGRFLLRDVRMIGGDEEFPCDGPRFSAGTDAERVIVHMQRSTVEDCRRGIRFGRGADGLISDSRIADCELRGLRAASNALVSVEGTTIENNGGGGSVEDGFGGVAVSGSAVVDLGGGTLEIDGKMVSSAGENSLCFNFGPDGFWRDLDNATATSTPAVGNWWCSTGSPANQIVGEAQFAPFLGRAPLRVRPDSR